MSSTKAIILAAGRGSRMKNLTEEKPKGLVEFRNKPLIDWQIETIRSLGITEISIVTGYKRELFKSKELFEFHNPRWAETNMVYSLCRADDWLSETDCIISYSDIFYHASHVKLLKDSPNDFSITYDKNWLELWTKRFADPLDDAETFKEQDGKLLEIGNRPTSLSEVTGQYMGLLKFKPNGWKQIKKILNEQEPNFDQLDMTSLLNLLLSQNLYVAAIPTNEEWYEFDSIEDLMVVNDD